MRLGSTAWWFAELAPTALANAPRATPATAEHLRRQAGPPLLSTHEVRVARSGFSLPPLQTGYVRVSSRLDDAHHDIDNGRTSFAGDVRRQSVQSRVVDPAGPGVLRGWSPFADATFVIHLQRSGSRGITPWLLRQ